MRLFFLKARVSTSVQLLLCLASLSGTAQTPSHQPQTNEKGDHKILIVVLSRTGNTKAVADMIQEHAGGNLITLSLVKPYPTDYQAQVDQVVKENETGFLPPLSTKIDSIASYDVIFVGFPTWGMKLPPPIKTFLKSYSLRGKTVVPFNTNGGYGIGSSFDTFKRLCAGCKVLDGFWTKGGVERDGVLLAIDGSRKEEVNGQIIKWIKSLHLSKGNNEK